MNKVILPITVTGTVVHGNKDGRKLGFPTANLRLASPLTIPHGVYAARVYWNDQHYLGIVHYGPRSVFGETHELFEVHIFNFSQEIYDDQLTATLEHFQRPTCNFDSLDALVAQIHQDCATAKNLLKIVS